MPKETAQIYTIPPSVPFLKTLACSLLEGYEQTPENLSDVLILLPTRRACRALQEEFLVQIKDKPLLLPRLQPIGDINAEEIGLLATDNSLHDMPALIPPMKRQILLAQLIGRLPNYSRTPDQNLKLAATLGQLLDEIQTENLDIQDLPNVVDKDDFAEHWQIILKFLEIIAETWPTILKEYNAIDAADYRNRLILALTKLWQQNPPSHPVILAGSTGTIPATAQLMQTISTLPNGKIILPGVDQLLINTEWQNIAEGHPQATLKKLIEELDLHHTDIKEYKIFQERNLAKEKIISQVMLSAEDTLQWQNNLNLQKDDLNVRRYDCDTSQEEADIIALILRETLENPNKTAAFITPDRALAKRVQHSCKRWGIEIDDSAGTPLNETKIGHFLLLCAHTLATNIDPLPLLSFLKHEKTFLDFKNFKKKIYELEQYIYRGNNIQNGFEGLKEFSNENNFDDFIDHLEKTFSKNLQNFQFEKNFSTLIKLHLQTAENFSKKSESLWSGDEGEAASQFFSNLYDQADLFDDVSGHEYVEIIENLMQAVTVRPKYGKHPRLNILGQIEARLVHADRVIMGGLNEGTWPPDPGHDPWMSLPMRKKYGLPPAERGLSLAAHDFSQAFCAPEVFLTRAKKVNGSVTVPARWLERLDTFLSAQSIEPETIRDKRFSHYLKALNKNTNYSPTKRPEPKPPTDVRPKKLSVTRIEKWINDPYGVYAEKILNLKKLRDIGKEPDAAIRGTILHEAFHKFIDAYPKEIPDEALETLITIMRKSVAEQGIGETDTAFWMPRLLTLAKNFIDHEKQWRSNYTPYKTEQESSYTLEDVNFELTARIDRIDKDKNEKIGIIDYKSGGQYSLSKMITGETPQLTLEGLILNDGKTEVASLSYWVVDGKSQQINEKRIDDNDMIEAIENCRAGLTELIQKFQQEETPYYAIPNPEKTPRYNDYEHLARIKEWSALDDQSEAA
ncbi:MAG: double-strand break repair protein AddB [Pseudomonadota bacterium]